MKKTLLIFILIFTLYGCENNKKTLPINLEINKDYQENVIHKNEIKINIPIGWKVLSEENKKSVLKVLSSNSQYIGNVQYWLTLSNKGKNSYPNISVNIIKSPDLTRLGINEFTNRFINTLDSFLPIYLDGVRSVITNYSELGNYIDKKNKTSYIINEADVANVGKIKTIVAIVFKKNYIISIGMNSFPKNFDRFKSSFQIMVNSIRI